NAAPTFQTPLRCFLTNDLDWKPSAKKYFHRCLTSMICSNGFNLKGRSICNTLLGNVMYVRVLLQQLNFILTKMSSITHNNLHPRFRSQLLIKTQNPQDGHFFQSVHLAGHSSELLRVSFYLKERNKQINTGLMRLSKIVTVTHLYVISG
ncbi:hypothetical protein A8990_13860, partial [Paenibacillus taihuensis]